MSETQSGLSETAIESRSGTDQYLTFMLGGEEYGIDILSVQEIKGWDSATPIPNTPPYVLGVINLRGTVVPILDLRVRFDLPEAGFGPTTVIIVVRTACEDHDRTVGVVVDAVSEVYNVAADAVEPPPDLGDTVSTEFVQGLTRVDEKMVILLDVEQLVSFSTGGGHEAITH